jgi:hypothetical protein
MSELKLTPENLVDVNGSTGDFAINGSKYEVLIPMPTDIRYDQLPSSLLRVTVGPEFFLPVFQPYVITFSRGNSLERLKKFDFIIENQTGGLLTVKGGRNWVIPDVLVENQNFVMINVFERGRSAFGYIFTASPFGGPISDPLASVPINNWGAGTGRNLVGSGNVAVGTNVLASTNSVVLGFDAKALSPGGVVMGQSAQSNGLDSIALGRIAQTLGQGAIALGTASFGGGRDSLAIGTGTGASGDFIQTIGAGINNTTPNTTLIGHTVDPNRHIVRSTGFLKSRESVSCSAGFEQPIDPGTVTQIIATNLPTILDLQVLRYDKIGSLVDLAGNRMFLGTFPEDLGATFHVSLNWKGITDTPSRNFETELVWTAPGIATDVIVASNTLYIGDTIASQTLCTDVSVPFISTGVNFVRARVRRIGPAVGTLEIFNVRMTLHRVN